MESVTKLSHYEISTLLCKGGMGEVWRASDTKLGREVAIKTLPEEFAKDAGLGFEDSGTGNGNKLDGHAVWYATELPTAVSVGSLC